MPDDFKTFYSIICLHAYMAQSRLDRDNPTQKRMSQEIADTFAKHLEDKLIVDYSIYSSRTTKKYMYQWLDSYVGTGVGYDEGLQKGDDVLASALWRYRSIGENNRDAHSLKTGTFSKRTRK